MLNQEQVKKLAKWLAGTLGGFLLGWAASRGYQWGDIIGQLLSSEVFIGILASGITAVLAWVTGRVPNLVGVVDAIAQVPNSPVKAVVMEATPEGKAIASNLGPTTVVAGTVDATAIAKAA